MVDDSITRDELEDEAWHAKTYVCATLVGLEFHLKRFLAGDDSASARAFARKTVEDVLEEISARVAGFPRR